MLSSYKSREVGPDLEKVTKKPDAIGIGRFPASGESAENSCNFLASQVKAS
jgi:hypothetical protein